MKNETVSITTKALQSSAGAADVSDKHRGAKYGHLAVPQSPRPSKSDALTLGVKSSSTRLL